MPRLQDQLRELAERASPRTAFFFIFAFVLLVAWIVVALVSGGG